MAEQSRLKNNRRYEKAFIKHDQTREQRLLTGNFRAVVSALKHINGGDSNVSLRGMRVVRNTEQNCSIQSYNIA